MLLLSRAFSYLALKAQVQIHVHIVAGITHCPIRFCMVQRIRQLSLPAPATEGIAQPRTCWASFNRFLTKQLFFGVFKELLLRNFKHVTYYL